MWQMMGTFIGKSWKIGATLILGCLAFLFWWVKYPSALAFHEQFQLFLFDGGYFAERMAQPGGLGRWLAEFLVQFYNNPLFGAVIIAILYMLIQRLCWVLIRRQCRADASLSLAYLLSFIPVLMVWYLMGDTNTMLSFVVSFLLALVAMWAWPRGKWSQVAFVVLGLPLLYWFIGPAMLMVALYVGLRLFTEKDTHGALYAAAVIVYAVAVVLASGLLAPYPLSSLFRGIDYHRFPKEVPPVMVATMALTALLPFVASWLCNKVKLRGPYVAAVTTMLLLTLWYVVSPSYDAKTYGLIDYDFLVRTGQWNAILDKASKDHLDLPMSVCATNLALGMTNQMGERLFGFYQHGVQGMFPGFERNFTSSLLNGEVYFQLGMVNTAQRFAFETMEMLPNNNKSCRAVKRLVETNLIGGHYKVAEKYISMLEKTMFYRKWAKRTRQLLGNEQTINNDPVYGKLRRRTYNEDFLFSETEQDRMVGQLFLRDSTNTLAMQYLMAYPLLSCDLDKVVQYLPVVQQKANYFPSLCQQALGMAYAGRRQTPPEGLVTPQVINDFAQFSRIVSNEGPHSPSLDVYRHTFWYYILQNQKQ